MRKYVQCVGSEVLTAAVMKSSVFWDITLCSPLKFCRRFGGTCSLHQGRITSHVRNQHEAGSNPGLFFDPEDAGDLFLRNVS
jgi:hypothetical protein